MSPLYVLDNKLLLGRGNLASDSSCCCCHCIPCLPECIKVTFSGFSSTYENLDPCNCLDGLEAVLYRTSSNKNIGTTEFILLAVDDNATQSATLATSPSGDINLIQNANKSWSFPSSLTVINGGYGYVNPTLKVIYTPIQGVVECRPPVANFDLDPNGVIQSVTLVDTGEYWWNSDCAFSLSGEGEGDEEGWICAGSAIRPDSGCSVGDSKLKLSLQTNVDTLNLQVNRRDYINCGGGWQYSDSNIISITASLFTEDNYLKSCDDFKISSTSITGTCSNGTITLEPASSCSPSGLSLNCCGKIPDQLELSINMPSSVPASVYPLYNENGCAYTVYLHYPSSFILDKVTSEPYCYIWSGSGLTFDIRTVGKASVQIEPPPTISQRADGSVTTEITATAEIGNIDNNGSITKINITDGGSGYAWSRPSRTPPTLTISGGSGSGAIFTPTLQSGVYIEGAICPQYYWELKSVDVSGGSGYVDGEQLTITLAEGDEGGGAEAYIHVGRSQPTLTLEGNAVVNIVYALNTAGTSWRVSAVNIISGGSGYIDNEELSFILGNNDAQLFGDPSYARVKYNEPTNAVFNIYTGASPSSGVGAVLQPVWELLPTTQWPASNKKTYRLSSVNVINGGNGYTQNDYVEISFPSIQDGDIIDHAYMDTVVDINGTIQEIFITTWDDIYDGPPNTTQPAGRYIGSQTGELDSVVIGYGGWYKDDPNSTYVNVPYGGSYYHAGPDEVCGGKSPSIFIYSMTGQGAVASGVVDISLSSPTFGQVIDIPIISGGLNYTDKSVWLATLSGYVNGYISALDQPPDPSGSYPPYYYVNYPMGVIHTAILTRAVEPIPENNFPSAEFLQSVDHCLLTDNPWTSVTSRTSEDTCPNSLWGQSYDIALQTYLFSSSLDLFNPALSGLGGGGWHFPNSCTDGDCWQAFDLDPFGIPQPNYVWQVGAPPFVIAQPYMLGITAGVSEV